MARASQTIQKPQRRLAFVRLVFLILFSILAVRLFMLQVMDYKFYAALASGQHDLYAKLLPERGQILVQDPLSPAGVFPVAANKPLSLIYSSPKDVPDAQTTAEVLAPILEKEQDELNAILGKKTDPWEPLLHNASDELVEKVKSLQLPGIYSAPEMARYYPAGELFSQLVGFVGFSDGKKQGQYGVERFYESLLAGTQGEIRSQKDAAGRLIALGNKDLLPATNGADVVLTIDKNIQVKACTSLTEAVKKHGAQGGSVIIMDPTSGAIRALCNAPTFDSNKYFQVKNGGVFINAAVSSPYEPGSVFKAITMAAALNEKKVEPSTTYDDTGEVTIGPNTIRNSDNKAHGVQTMTNVLEESLNTGAIFAMRQISVKTFANYIRLFGFGDKLGIDLPHEQSGNVKSLNGKSEIYSATASFGQGITVTPLQLVAAFGAIANRGKLMKPYVVQEVRKTDGTVQITRSQISQNVITPNIADTLSAMLVSAVERGHGKRAGVPGYYVAGKTGTAQIPKLQGGGYEASDLTIGSFVGFAPVDNPKFVMVVKIDRPNDVVFAESTAAPLFGEIAKYLLDYYQIPPTRSAGR